MGHTEGREHARAPVVEGTRAQAAAPGSKFCGRGRTRAKIAADMTRPDTGGSVLRYVVIDTTKL